MTKIITKLKSPLKFLRLGSAAERDVWPEENEIDLAMTELFALKASRDRENFPLTELYPREGPKQLAGTEYEFLEDRI